MVLVQSASTTIRREFVLCQCVMSVMSASQVRQVTRGRSKPGSRNILFLRKEGSLTSLVDVVAHVMGWVFLCHGKGGVSWA